MKKKKSIFCNIDFLNVSGLIKGFKNLKLKGESYGTTSK